MDGSGSPEAQRTADASLARHGFERQVRDALLHLHDPGHLQAHPLTSFLHAEPSRPATLGRALRQAILDAVVSLRPTAEVSANSHAYRTCQILRLRFVDALEVAQVLDRLSLSKSLYYLELQRAIESVSAVLWERWRVDERDVAVGSGSARSAARGEAGPAASGRRVGGEEDAAIGRARTNLPAQLTSFVGRESEMAEVRCLLGTTRLLTLTGTGGCGKTRLAYQVAEQILQERPAEYPDGIWVAELASLSEPTLIPQTVASALGLPEQPGRSSLDLLEGNLRARRLLLIFDNCEHLLDGCASLADSLLRACPRLSILATSRELLGVEGELAWRVTSLSMPDPERLGTHPLSAENAMEYEAIRLFVERARLVQPSFSATEQNAACLAEICRRLDGMPLAIELAAARVRALSVEDLASRLDDRFRLLTGGSRRALRRQQTLRATIDWSFDLLSEPEKILFRRLSVFSGGWTAESAEEVCSAGSVAAGDVLDLLLRLVDRSLVVAVTEPYPTCYRLPETIRQYAQETLLASGETEAIRQAHVDSYARLVERARPELDGQRQREWLDRLEDERDNLRAALSWLEGAGDVSGGLRMANGLMRLWMQRGPISEAVARLTALLEQEGARETPLGVEGLANLAYFTCVAAGSRAGRPIADEALRIARAIGDPRALSHALWGRGYNAESTDEEIRLLSEALEVNPNAGEVLRGHLTSRRARVAWTSGDLVGARALYEESLATFRRLGGPWMIGGTLFMLGQVALQQGNLAEAWSLIEESVRDLQASGERTFVGWPVLSQATILRLRGDYESARRLAEEVLALGRKLDNHQRVTRALAELGLIASARGDFELARQHLEASLSRVREFDDRSNLTRILANLGLVARAEGDYVEARELLAESLALERDGGERIDLAACLGNLGVVALCESHLDEAGELFHESLALRRQIGALGGLATLLECFGGLAALRHAPERALRLAGAAARVREENGNVAPPVWRRQRDPWLDRARRALGPAASAAAWAKGQAMTLEKAVDSALKE